MARTTRIGHHRRLFFGWWCWYIVVAWEGWHKLVGPLPTVSGFDLSSSSSSAAAVACSRWISRPRHRRTLLSATATPPLLRVGLLADIQYAPIPDGTSYTGTPRYYRNALRVARTAAQYFQDQRIPLVIHLGDLVDGKCQDLTAWGGGGDGGGGGPAAVVRAPPGQDPGVACANHVLEALAAYQAGPILHAYGNHCLYNMDRETLRAKLGIPFFPEAASGSEELVAYHDSVYSPEANIRWVVLDCYDIAKLRRDKASPKYQEATRILRRKNPNYHTNDNSPQGLQGLDRRYVAFNGAVGPTQLAWLRATLDRARRHKERVILVSHLPLLPGSSGPVCLLWNYAEVLQVLRAYPDVVALSLSGHAHKGGYRRDPASGIHFRVVEAVLENPPPHDTFATLNIYDDRIAIDGRGNCASATYDLQHMAEEGSSPAAAAGGAAAGSASASASASPSPSSPSPLSSLSSAAASASPPEPPQHADVVICGGGPAGLLSAIMLAREQLPTVNRIHVYDRLAPPPDPDNDEIWQTGLDKFYLIGLGGRGQSALKRFGVWDAVQARCVGVVGRRDWPPNDLAGPGVETIFDEKEKIVTTQVLPRDKLVGILYREIQERYADRIVLHYGYEIEPLDFAFQNGHQVLLRVAQCSEKVAGLNFSAVKTSTGEEAGSEMMCDVETNPTFTLATDLLLAADGTVRTIANKIQAMDEDRLAGMNVWQRWVKRGSAFRVTRYPDDNQRIYKTFPLQLPSDWRYDLNYSARSQDGRVVFDVLPSNANGSYCGVLLLKTSDPLAAADTNPAELRQLLEDYLPRFSALVDDATLEVVAKKSVSYLPGFRYAGPRLHEGNRCVLLGDCAHTVKPYFGLGANSALEDVSILCDVLRAQNYDLSATVHAYSALQAPQAKELVRLSRELDRPGVLGFFTFVLPIILDAIFGKAFPQLFMPNIIRMLQREDYTFEEVGRRKRQDRVVQVFLLGTFLAGGGMLTQMALTAVTTGMPNGCCST